MFQWRATTSSQRLFTPDFPVHFIYVVERHQSDRYFIRDRHGFSFQVFENRPGGQTAKAASAKRLTAAFVFRDTAAELGFPS